MRSIWSGSIDFGLVNIPIKLYSATQDSALDMDMLDKKTGDHAFQQLKASLANPPKKRAS